MKSLEFSRILWLRWGVCGMCLWFPGIPEVQRGEWKLSILTLRRPQNSQPKNLYAWTSGQLGVCAEISCKTVKLGHWYSSNCGVWLQIPGLGQSKDLACHPPESTPIFSCETGVLMNFYGLAYTSFKNECM